VVELEADAVQPRQDTTGTSARQPEVYELDELDPYEAWQHIELAS
jgi:hypothetical protein